MAVELGATLYIPVQRPNLLAVAHGSMPGLRSIVMCLEDTLPVHQIVPAKARFVAVLQELTQNPPALLVYARPRDPAMLEWMLRQDHIGAIAGFVLPKITTANLGHWLAATGPGEYGLMPTIESAEAFDHGAMSAIAQQLDALGPRIHAVRIGGNDILNTLGVRRSALRTAYDGPLGLAIATMAAVFLPRDIGLSAPVFEHYDSLELLREEVMRDVEHGLLTKTAIHPDQIRVIHDVLRPTAYEVEEAQAILHADAQAVFGRAGSMCEPTTHSRWARTVLRRAQVHGASGSLHEVDARVA